MFAFCPLRGRRPSRAKCKNLLNGSSKRERAPTGHWGSKTAGSYFDPWLGISLCSTKNFANIVFCSMLEAQFQSKKIDNSEIRTHTNEISISWNQRLRPLGHTSDVIDVNFIVYKLCHIHFKKNKHSLVQINVRCMTLSLIDNGGNN